MRYLDLFTGYGGFTLGIQQAYEDLSKTKRKQQRRTAQNSPDIKQSLLATKQLACVGFSEINKYAIQTYQKHFPSHKNYGDITKIKPAELPDFDLITGGFPCQAFSIAGKRKGFNDTRGTLFFDIARIIKEKRPKYLLLENVKGLLSHDNGRTFKTIIATLTELWYDLQWQVLNAKNFGVPQNRERVFIIGHLR
ncbi:MAG: DNA cytosine methyltransferase, partial [Candidatus Omnitrophica bacterium]|nr:DNA cytosine methyltransferase [Candidatus Omnitrophota bacterium]